jgi:TPR repeat protein
VLAGWLYWNAAQQRKVAEEQRAVAEEQKKQADHILGGATGIIVELQHQMNDSTKKQVFAVFQAGADHGDAISMANLGKLYQYGQGVALDYVKARDWYEKGAHEGEAEAMTNLDRKFVSLEEWIADQSCNANKLDGRAVRHL